MRRRAATRVAAVGLALAAVVGTAGCTSARNTLGTNAGACLGSLPVAEDAVHGRGAFAGVLLVRSSALEGHRVPTEARVRAELERRAGHRLASVCVVAYSGSFTDTQVQKPVTGAGPVPSGQPGRYAVVVTTYPGHVLLGTIVTDREPLRFLHWRVGA